MPMSPLLVALVLTLSLVAQADETAETVQKRLQQKYPATHIERVENAEIPALYEVIMGRNSAYTDAAGRYFIFGHLFDMQAQRDLTAERLEQQQRVAFAELPLGDAIRTIHGKGERVLAVFSDPDCPYCKQLEGELAKVDNVTIYTFAYPLESLHPQAKDKAIAVWCAPDRARAWADLMKSGKAPATRSCDHPIERNLALGQRLGIHGTPTLLSPDGRILPGAATREHIEQWLTERRP